MTWYMIEEDEFTTEKRRFLLDTPKFEGAITKKITVSGIEVHPLN